MKKYLFTLRKPFCLGFGLCTAILFFLSGCKPITSMDISGVYIRAANGVVDTLILATNGSSQQTITFTNGGQWTKNSSWKFSGEVVTFDEFYEAFEIDPSKTGNIVPILVIPPHPYSTDVLWVEQGKLLKNPEEPIWINRPIAPRYQWPTSGRFGDKPKLLQSQFQRKNGNILAENFIKLYEIACLADRQAVSISNSNGLFHRILEINAPGAIQCQ